MDNCYASGILESIEGIKAGIPRWSPDGSGDTDEVFGRVLHPLRALRLEPIMSRPENVDKSVCEVFAAC